MFKPEHLDALRHQIRSLNAAQLPKDHPFAAEFNVTIGDQAKLLEEIRIEIHNALSPAKASKKELLENGILA